MIKSNGQGKKLGMYGKMTLLKKIKWRNEYLIVNKKWNPKYVLSVGAWRQNLGLA